MIRLLSFLHYAALFSLIFVVHLSCNEDDNNPSSSSQSVCDQLTVSNSQPDISFKSPCNSFERQVSNIQYNSFSQVTSFDFNIRCTTTSESYSGKVSNIVRNGLGEITSYQATVNGVSCNYP